MYSFLELLVTIITREQVEYTWPQPLYLSLHEKHDDAILPKVRNRGNVRARKVSRSKVKVWVSWLN